MTRAEKTSTNLLKHGQDWFKEQKTWITLVAFAAATILYYLDKVVKSPAAVVACGVLFLATVVERLITIADDVAKVLELQRARVQPLYTLAQCMDDLHQRLDNTPRGGKVVIKHLGLNMVEAWNDLKRALADCDSGVIRCDVLIMTDDPDELGPDAPPEVRGWCTDVPSAITRISQEATALGLILAKRSASLEFTLRKYKGTPRIHGVAITEPFARGYVSFASWAQNAKFEWGGDDYFTFETGTVSTADRRLRELLLGAFEHLSQDDMSDQVFVYPQQTATT